MIYSMKIRGDCFYVYQEKPPKKLQLIFDNSMLDLIFWLLVQQQLLIPYNFFILNLNNSSDLYTKRDGRNNVVYYSHGQAGTSVHYNHDKNFVFGAPGISNWRGEVNLLVY